MTQEDLKKYLKTYCHGRENARCSRELEKVFSIRESSLRKMVNGLRRKGVPIASGAEGYYYANNAVEVYATIRELTKLRNGLDASISGLEASMYRFGGDSP